MKSAEARQLFDRNAATYDPVNSVVSLGLDRRWRKWVAMNTVRRPRARVLDAMSGAGEVAVEAARLGADVLAADVSPQMLERACKRAARYGVRLRTLLTDVCDKNGLPEGRRFDAACVSFGLRYADDKVGLLRSLADHVRPGGRLVVLEFCVPHRGLISTLAAFYFFRVLPALAGLLAGQAELYRYLRDSTREVGTAEEILGVARKAGLEVVESKTFGFGLVFGMAMTVP